jgi:hypothetical protein
MSFGTSGPGSAPASVSPQPRQADDGQHRAREKHRDKQAIEAELRDRRRHQNNECTRRTADLKPAAAQSGHQKAADDRGVEAAHRLNAGGNGDCHRQRQRHHRDSQRSHEVAAKGSGAVAFGNERNQLGAIKVGCGGTVRHCGGDVSQGGTKRKSALVYMQ